jgi:hypothetical protein
MAEHRRIGAILSPDQSDALSEWKKFFSKSEKGYRPIRKQGNHAQPFGTEQFPPFWISFWNSEQGSLHTLFMTNLCRSLKVGRKWETEDTVSLSEAHKHQILTKTAFASSGDCIGFKTRRRI